MSALSAEERNALRRIVPDLLLDLASRIGKPHWYTAGQPLFDAGERAPGVHLIVAGAVRIVREGDRRAVVLHRETAGGLLGEIACFGDGTYPARAVAMEPTHVLLLPARQLTRELRDRRDVAEFFLRRLARRSHEIIRRLDRLAHHTVLRRLAGYLLDRPRSHRGVVSLGMTQSALAEELGTVKEVIVRELRALRRLGLIEPAGRGMYRVADESGLRSVARTSSGWPISPLRPSR